MAKRIEFLAPVEAMRGNLSGSQKLLYPTQDNSAYDAPSNKQSYATNYSTRYIGAKRSRDGLKFFSVRQRSSVTMSPAVRRNMALLGSSSEFANRIMRNLSALTDLQELFTQYAPTGYTFKRWIAERVRLALNSLSPTFQFDPSGDPTTLFQNPYAPALQANAKSIASTLIADKPELLDRIVFKFWEVLGVVSPKVMPVEVQGYGIFYMLASTSITFVTQYGDQLPENFWQPNHTIFDKLGNPMLNVIVSNSPDVTTVRTMAPGTIDFYVLYRHAANQTAADDVIVDSVTMNFEEGYVYTFKPE